MRFLIGKIMATARRSPYGERGLKSRKYEDNAGNAKSLSLRRAWIEMSGKCNAFTAVSSRSPYGERGLKYLRRVVSPPHHKSLSLRRAWIEMIIYGMTRMPRRVALLTESVD